AGTLDPRCDRRAGGAGDPRRRERPGLRPVVAGGGRAPPLSAGSEADPLPRSCRNGSGTFVLVLTVRTADPRKGEGAWRSTCCSTAVAACPRRRPSRPP